MQLASGDVIFPPAKVQCMETCPTLEEQCMNARAHNHVCAQSVFVKPSISSRISLHEYRLTHHKLLIVTLFGLNTTKTHLRAELEGVIRVVRG